MQKVVIQTNILNEKKNQKGNKIHRKTHSSIKLIHINEISFIKQKTKTKKTTN